MKTHVLEIPGTPPSYNTTAHAHWTTSRRAKKDWEQFCFAALLLAKVPKGLERISATAELHFKVKRRRDEGNFRVILEKALGDALVGGGWLPDDTPEHYSFGGVALLAPLPEQKTVVTLVS